MMTRPAIDVKEKHTCDDPLTAILLRHDMERHATSGC